MTTDTPMVDQLEALGGDVSSLAGYATLAKRLERRNAELRAALEAVTTQLELVTNGPGQVHDERQAIVTARAALTQE